MTARGWGCTGCEWCQEATGGDSAASEAQTLTRVPLAPENAPEGTTRAGNEASGRFRCNQCGKSWRERRAEHCKVCHETFSGTTAGDRHRIGDHGVRIGPNRRRCLTATEMLGRGMARNDRGIWTNGGESPWAK